jgi:hypothetical protein
MHIENAEHYCFLLPFCYLQSFHVKYAVKPVYIRYPRESKNIVLYNLNAKDRKIGKPNNLKVFRRIKPDSVA